MCRICLHDPVHIYGGKFRLCVPVKSQAKNGYEIGRVLDGVTEEQVVVDEGPA